MSQIFGYICSDDSLTSEVMKQYGEPLRAIEPDRRVGLGIGLLQEGRSLLRKHPRRKAASVDIPALLGDIASRSLIGYVRHQDSGSVGTKQLQPFRFRNWVYAQHGKDEELDQAYGALEESVPDHVRQNIESDSMAELLFHVFYTKVESDLSTTPRAEWPGMYAEKLAETVITLREALRNGDRDGLSELQTMAITDRCVVALNVGSTLHYRLVEGIEESTEEPLFAGHNPKSVMHDRFRALLVANRVENEEWTEIPNHHVMWIDGDWEIHTAEIGEVV